jgi:hypothetical protein
MLWRDSPQVFPERADLIFTIPLSTLFLPDTPNIDEFCLKKVRLGVIRTSGGIISKKPIGIFSIFEKESASLKWFLLNNFKSRQNTGDKLCVN